MRRVNLADIVAIRPRAVKEFYEPVDERQDASQVAHAIIPWETLDLDISPCSEIALISRAPGSAGDVPRCRSNRDALSYVVVLHGTIPAIRFASHKSSVVDELLRLKHARARILLEVVFSIHNFASVQAPKSPFKDIIAVCAASLAAQIVNLLRDDELVEF